MVLSHLPSPGQDANLSQTTHVTLDAFKVCDDSAASLLPDVPLGDLQPGGTVHKSRPEHAARLPAQSSSQPLRVFLSVSSWRNVYTSGVGQLDPGSSCSTWPTALKQQWKDGRSSANVTRWRTWSPLDLVLQSLTDY